MQCMNGINTCTNSKYYRYFFFRLVITKEKQARGELFSINIRVQPRNGKKRPESVHRDEICGKACCCFR